MNKELVNHVFDSLQTIENYLSSSKKLLSSTSAKEDAQIGEQEKVIEKMRWVAYELQLEVSKNDMNTSLRLLRIFYGLNHMVRPEIIATYSSLSGKINSSTSSNHSQ